MNKLQPLIFAIEQYGQALDVFSNAYPLALSPLWGRYVTRCLSVVPLCVSKNRRTDFVLTGSIRVLLHLAREFGKYFERLVEMLARIGDVLPRFRVYENLFPRWAQPNDIVIPLLYSKYCPQFEIFEFCYLKLVSYFSARLSL